MNFLQQWYVNLKSCNEQSTLAPSTSKTCKNTLYKAQYKQALLHVNSYPASDPWQHQGVQCQSWDQYRSHICWLRTPSNEYHVRSPRCQGLLCAHNPHTILCSYPPRTGAQVDQGTGQMWTRPLQQDRIKFNHYRGFLLKNQIPLRSL